MSKTYIIIGAALAIFIVVFIYSISNKPKNEPFCSCRHETTKICPDPGVLTDLYNSNKLTEYTDFEKIRDNYGGGDKVWKVAMPEDEFALNNYQ